MLFYRPLIKLLSLLCFVTTTANAAVFPRGCEVSDFGFQDSHLILNEHGNQALYLIQNHSDKAIDLEHVETKDLFMSPKLHSKLDPLNWAAFASDTSNFHFKCFIQGEDITTTVNCADVLDVCQYPRVKFALSNMGTYWISTNKEQNQVIKDAAAKGIYLRW